MKKWTFEKRNNIDIWIREEEQETKPGVQHQPIQSRDVNDNERSMSDKLLRKLKDLEIQMSELSKKQTEMNQKQKQLEDELHWPVRP